MRGDDGAILPRGKFVPAAERYGLMLRICAARSGDVMGMLAPERTLVLRVIA